MEGKPMTGRKSRFSLDSLLDGAQLPALPQSAIRLLQLSQDPENGPAEFAAPIETDPGLTGQVLKFVNSSYFGFSREISSVKLAITLVGIRTIKNFSLWSAVFSLMPNPKCGPFDLKCLWQDSLRRGLFSRAVGHSVGQADSEDLFAAALLQDMAIPLLAKELPEEYNKLFHARRGGKVRLSEVEHERFGWNHAQAAAKLACGWSLPEEFAALIEHHAAYEDIQRAGGTHGQLTIALSALLPSAQDATWFEHDQFVEAYHELTGGSMSDLMTLLAAIDESFGEFAPVLKLGMPERSLVECLRSDEATVM